MLRKTVFAALFLSALVIFPNHNAQALERLMKGAPAQVGTLVTRQAKPDGPLTVIDVIVDKTATNAVLARDQAMAEAQRLAFQKLAERNMTPDEYKTFKTPDVKTIAGLVQDFEIKGEKLSSTRYVANFTVRFREAVRNYVHVQDAVPDVPAAQAIDGTDAGEELKVTANTKIVPAPSVAASLADLNTAAPLNTASEEDVLEVAPAKTYLILPYIESMSGKLILWEDPNPWRQVWQQNMPRNSGNGSAYIVPMGDISDVSAGSTDAVWSGNYSAIEKLRQNYRVDEVVLAVANKSSSYLTIDMYFFKNGGLLKREVLQPFVGSANDAEAFAAARNEVMKYLKNPQSAQKAKTVEAISRELTGKTAPAAVTTTTTTTTTTSTGPTEIEAMMNFNTPGAWMELQKRLSTLSPPVRLNIRSLSKSGAQFTVRYEGDIAALQQALATKDIALNKPSVEIDRGVAGGAASGMKPVYGFQILK